MPLGGSQAAERRGQFVRREAGGIEESRALDELDGRAAGRAERGTAARIEADLDDPLALDPDRDPDQVAAGGASGGAGMRPTGECAEPSRSRQVVVESHHGKRDIWGPSLPLPDPRVGPAVLANAGVLRGGPQPYREPDSLLGDVRLNVYGRLANRLEPGPTLAATG
jgi:hypothetical protein